MHPLVSVHRAAYAISDVTGLAVQTVLGSLGGIAAGLTVLLVFPLVARVAGRVRAVAAQLVVVALVATSPWVAVPYTDLLAMPLLTGAVLLVLRAADRRDRSGSLQLLASAVLAAGAIVLKTTPTVLVVAVAVVGLLLAIDLRATRRDAAGRARRHRGLGGRDAGARRVAVGLRDGGPGVEGAPPDAHRRDAPHPVVGRERHDADQEPGQPHAVRRLQRRHAPRHLRDGPEAASAWSREWIRHQGAAGRGRPGALLRRQGGVELGRRHVLGLG